MLKCLISWFGAVVSPALAVASLVVSGACQSLPILDGGSLYVNVYSKFMLSWAPAGCRQVSPQFLRGGGTRTPDPQSSMA